jgi:hypothetical protein
LFVILLGLIAWFLAMIGIAVERMNRIGINIAKKLDLIQHDALWRILSELERLRREQEKPKPAPASTPAPSVLDRLLGEHGPARDQLWPERLRRAAEDDGDK